MQIIALICAQNLGGKRRAIKRRPLVLRRPRGHYSRGEFALTKELNKVQALLQRILSRKVQNAHLSLVRLLSLSLSSSLLLVRCARISYFLANLFLSCYPYLSFFACNRACKTRSERGNIIISLHPIYSSSRHASHFKYTLV